MVRWLALGMALHAGAVTAGQPTDDESAVEQGAEGDADTLPEVKGSSGSVIDEAHRQLAAMKTSHYLHRTAIDEAEGRFDYDCSGFVSYALSRVKPEAYRAVREAAHRRPLAVDYVRLSTSKAWDRVDAVSALVPGDLIAWTKPADVVSKNTGHIMVVEQAPRQVHPGEWEIPIIDSTAAPHGKSDARKQRGDTGLGRGTIILAVSSTGAPTAYRWSTWSKSKLHATEVVLLRAK